MQTPRVLDETRPRVNSPSRSLRVVIAYEDLAAGKRAMSLLSQLGKHFGDDIQFEPLPWSFSLLADVDWCTVAASDAVRADILIIATSGVGPWPLAIDRWAVDAIGRKRGTSAAVVALFGPDENPDGVGSPRLAAIERMAHGAGLDFFAPTPRSEVNRVIAQIHWRAETITPVLEGILRQQDLKRIQGRTSVSVV